MTAVSSCISLLEPSKRLRPKTRKKNVQTQWAREKRGTEEQLLQWLSISAPLNKTPSWHPGQRDRGNNIFSDVICSITKCYGRHLTEPRGNTGDTLVGMPKADWPAPSQSTEAGLYLLCRAKKGVHQMSRKLPLTAKRCLPDSYNTIFTVSIFSVKTSLLEMTPWCLHQAPRCPASSVYSAVQASILCIWVSDPKSPVANTQTSPFWSVWPYAEHKLLWEEGEAWHAIERKVRRGCRGTSC